MQSTPLALKLRNREWAYISFVIAAFVFSPELRRIIEWVDGGFKSIDVLSSLALFMLVPVAIVVLKRWRTICQTRMVQVTAIWVGSCLYGLLTGWLHLELIPGIFGFAIFVLPLAVGLWIISLNEPITETFMRFTGILVVCGGVAGVYGIAQFVLAPPWDTAWMQSITADSFGNPVRFGIRVFGPLNSPQTNALFLTAVLLYSFSTLEVKRWWVIPATTAMAVSLILSMARTAWIELIVGLICLVLLSPERIRAATSIAVVSAIAVVGVISFLTFFPGADEGFNLAQRIDTFSAISEDGSAVQRRESASIAIGTAMENPAGLGIGTMGESAKLGDPSLGAFFNVPEVAIDEGYLTRLVELGYVGFIGFLATVVYALLITLSAYLKSKRGPKQYTGLIATCFAIQVGTILALFGGDTIQALTGLLYFVSVVLPICVLRELKVASSIVLDNPIGSQWPRESPYLS